MELNLNELEFLELLSSALAIILTLIIFLYLRGLKKYKKEEKEYFSEILVSKFSCMVINKESKIQFINQALKKYLEEELCINLEYLGL